MFPTTHGIAACVTMAVVHVFSIEVMGLTPVPVLDIS